MSKFEHECFYADDGVTVYYCVNKAKYAFEEAKEIAAYELDSEVEFVADDWMVRHGFGVDEDGENRIGWWLSPEKVSRGCEVWTFERRCAARRFPA